MKRQTFEEQIRNLSLEELRKLASALSIKSTRAEYSSSDKDKELQQQLLIVKNRITALSIRQS